MKVLNTNSPSRNVIMFSTRNLKISFSTQLSKIFLNFSKFMLNTQKIFLDFMNKKKCRKEIFTDNIFVSLCKRIISVYETNH
ncbi:hypothetical protein HanRHA438_Chr11g0501761 [Helianthus annuus]|nr:hypothetical protein HanRHA438_Chr11g0501761 [Helianthus annuus]